MPRFIMLLAVSIFAVALIGCSNGDDGKKSSLGESCAKTADCEGDLRCVNQKCVADTTDGDIDKDKEINQTTICTTYKDCPDWQPVCNIDPITTMGKCGPNVNGDIDNDTIDKEIFCTNQDQCGDSMYCECGKCFSSSKRCSINSDCKTPCQTCKSGACIGDASPCAHAVCSGDEDSDTVK